MRHFDRLMTTAIIWGAFTAIMIAAPNVSDNFIIVIVLGIAAAASTSSVWEGAKPDQADSKTGTHSEKAKRRERDPIARLVEVLDEDERAELRRRLIADQDGELVDLDTLMQR